MSQQDIYNIMKKDRKAWFTSNYFCEKLGLKAHVINKNLRSMARYDIIERKEGRFGDAFVKHERPRINIYMYRLKEK